MSKLFWGVLLFIFGYVGYALAVAAAWLVILIMLYGMDQREWLFLLIPVAIMVVIYLRFYDAVDQWIRRQMDQAGR